jgi:hypothetical protein
METGMLEYAAEEIICAFGINFVIVITKFEA